jgi:cytochrome c oxidase subunit 2
MHVHKLEKIWLTFGGLMLAAFLVVLTINAFAMGNTPPSDLQQIDPTKVDQTPPFDKPGLVKISENEYDLNMIGYAFGYTPALVEIPKGATVHFHVTSRDVMHGFEVAGTDVNMMLTPGLVNSVTKTFNDVGTFLILCNEYCGTGHQIMAAHLVVK